MGYLFHCCQRFCIRIAEIIRDPRDAEHVSSEMYFHIGSWVAAYSTISPPTHVTHSGPLVTTRIDKVDTEGRFQTEAGAYLDLRMGLPEEILPMSWRSSFRGWARWPIAHYSCIAYSAVFMFGTINRVTAWLLCYGSPLVDKFIVALPTPFSTKCYEIVHHCYYGTRCFRSCDVIFWEIKPGGILFFILSIETIKEVREIGRQRLDKLSRALVGH